MPPRIVIALVSALALIAADLPAAAADGFDSAYAGESSFLTITAGQTGSFTVFFTNTGTTTWTKGTATQVDLAACLSDQTICDAREPRLEAFDPGSWPRSGRYAVQNQSAVAPGSTGTFTYSVRVPAGQAPGRYRFNGDLVVSASGQKVHPEGYYHELTVEAAQATCSPASITTSAFDQEQVGKMHERKVTLRCADGTKAANVEVKVVAAGSTAAGNPSLTLTGTTDSSGVATISWTRANPGSDTVLAYPVADQRLQASGTVRWTVAAKVLTCSPTDEATQSANSFRTYTITLRDPVNQGALLASTALDVTVAQFISFGTATINGNTVVGKTTTARVFSVTTDANGSASLNVGGSGVTIVPRVFLDEDANDVMGSGEFRVDCGSTTFSVVSQPVLSCAPSDTVALAAGVIRTFTVTARQRLNTLQPHAGATVSIAVGQRISSGTATINGTSIVGKAVDTTVLTVTTASDGTATLTVSAQNGTVAPRPFLDDDGDGVPDAGEYSVNCGITTYPSSEGS